MLKIIYDPRLVGLYAVPDGLVEMQVQHLIEAGKAQDIDYPTCQGILCDAARMCVAEGFCTTADVELWFKGEKLALNHYGVIKDWPLDFCGQGADFAERILRAGLRTRERERAEKKAAREETSS